jgi:hypothetical protein
VSLGDRVPDEFRDHRGIVLAAPTEAMARLELAGALAYQPSARTKTASQDLLNI